MRIRSLNSQLFLQGMCTDSVYRLLTLYMLLQIYIYHIWGGFNGEVQATLEDSIFYPSNTNLFIPLSYKFFLKNIQLIQHIFTIIKMNPGHQHQSSSGLSHEQIVADIKNRLNQIAATELSMTGQELQNLMNLDFVDRILGCAFGAFMGDALGSFCQFQTKQKITKKIERAIQMPGGGPFGTRPGQVTDDSQMALHLLQGLSLYNSQKPLNQQINLLLIAIGKQYVSWYGSMPFDIGNTCRSGVQNLQKRFKSQQQSPTTVQKQKQQYEKLRQCFKEIEVVNHSSLSNGFLMRITPMACFATLIKKFRENEINHLEKLIQGQNFMTHTHKQCIQASKIYIDLISELILRKNHGDIQTIQKKLQAKYSKQQNMNTYHQGIYLGFTAQKHKLQIIQADKKNIGFYQIAYYFTFFALRELASMKQQQINGNIFKNLMKYIIQKGGDTDTNACIAGGLIGSIVGFKKLPVEYVRKQLILQLGQNPFRINEKNYEPSRGFVNLIKLIKKFKKN